MRIERLSETDPASAQELLDRALAAYPDDADLHYMDGGLEHRAGHIDAARASYEKAAHLAPESVLIQGWVARFFLKALEEEEEALERYLTTYFLDPHFYDTEYAEGRVRHLAWERAEARIETARSGGASWAQILRSPDPMVLTGALESMEGEWDEELVPVLVGLVEHDIISIRGKAMDHLCRKLGPEHDDAIRDLLSSRDLRVMGLAICLAVDHWEEERWGEWAEQLLAHPAQLVRADAISALMLYGGERGRQMVMDYSESGREPNTRIIELMESQIEEAAGEAGADGLPPN